MECSLCLLETMRRRWMEVVQMTTVGVGGARLKGGDSIHGNENWGWQWTQKRLLLFFTAVFFLLLDDKRLLTQKVHHSYWLVEMTDVFLAMTLNTTVPLFVINAMLLCLLCLQGPGAENDSYASSLIDNKEFLSDTRSFWGTRSALLPNCTACFP